MAEFLRKHAKLPLLFLTAFAVRLLYIHLTGAGNMLDMDSTEYLQYANNLLAGNGYTDGKWFAFRPPGYPFFVAGVYSLFGKSLPALKIIQAAVSSLIPLLVYFMGRKLRNERTALAAALFSCFYLGLYQEPAHIISESVFTFLFAFSVYLLLKTEDHPAFFAAAGAMLGLAAFTRPVGLLMVPTALLWLALRFGRKGFLKGSLLLLAGFSAVLSPWWLRNYSLFHSFVPVCLETGFVMRHSHSSEEQLKRLFEFNNLPELERDRANFRTGLGYLRARTAPELLKRWTRNLLTFLYPFTPAFDFTYVLILPLWLYGLRLILKTRNKNAFILFSMFIYFPVAVFFFGTARYRHSLGVFFILIASIGAERLLAGTAGDGKKAKRLMTVSSLWAAANLFVLFYSEGLRTFLKNFVGGILN